MILKINNHRRNLFLLLFIVFVFIFLTKKIAFPNGSINFDEPVYIYQAETYASGRIYNATPAPQENFKQWFVVDHQGKRFGKYPFGASLLYTIGILINNIDIILPILAVLNIYLIYLLATNFFTEKESLIIALLSFFNPFFITHSSFFLSHSPDLFYLLLVLFLFIKTIKNKSSLSALATGFFLSLSFNTRPLTAVAFSIPLMVIGIIHLKKNFHTYANLLFLTILGFIPLFCAFFVYNKILTGNTLTLPFSLWCDADKIGFGLRAQSWANKIMSFHFFDAIKLTLVQLKTLVIYWPLILFFIPAILYLRDKKYKYIELILLTFIIIHIGLYFFHFISSPALFSFYGPYYYFELIPFFAVIIFAGMKYSYLKLKNSNKLFKKFLMYSMVIIICMPVIFDLIKYYQIEKIYTEAFAGFEQELKSDKFQNDKLLLFVDQMPLFFENLYLRFPQLVNSPNLNNQRIIFARNSVLGQNQEVINKYGQNRHVWELKWQSGKFAFILIPYVNHLPPYEYKEDGMCVEY